MDPDLLWHSLGGSAIIAAALTLARLLFDHYVRGIERRLERDERHSLHQRDAEARLERMLQDRLAEADRRLEREHVLLLQSHELLREQYLALQADRLRHLDGCIPVARTSRDARDARDSRGSRDARDANDARDAREPATTRAGAVRSARAARTSAATRD
jgi:hypothetical protein